MVAVNKIDGPEQEGQLWPISTAWGSKPLLPGFGRTPLRHERFPRRPGGGPARAARRMRRRGGGRRSAWPWSAGPTWASPR
ncbi:MAG: hypothetical protein MZV70_64370 [Desulfobacterales bacterium]|nr:hypothetical protein [Desulfobacterales bacterium]